jgi:segregation and condensation protein A
VAYLVDLEAFHGPLDLLLYLIEKNEVELDDIPIAIITDQYMQYLSVTGDYDLERMGDFLLMASYLLNLKSRLLLPRGIMSEEEEEEDPRTDLMQKLIEYKKYKAAAQWLLDLESGLLPRVYFRNASEGLATDEQLLANSISLLRAYRAILRRMPEADELYELPDDDISIPEKMQQIMLALHNPAQEIWMQQLFAGISGRREALALFLALLELIRLQKVTAIQENNNEDIKIYLRVELSG